MSSDSQSPLGAQQRESWLLLRCSAALGALGALTGLIFLGIVNLGSHWAAYSRPGWFGGHWWWVAVTSIAGVIVGLLRRLTRLPNEVPGFFDDLKSEQLDYRLVPGTMAASALSLMAGASVGPEKVLATIGGGAGSWIARRAGMRKEDTTVTTLAGIAGMFGGLFSSPLIVVMLTLEGARPGGRRFSKDLVAAMVAASISFGIYFAVAGAVFLGAYRVPPYRFADWQLLVSVPLGLFAALITVTGSGFMAMTARFFGWLRISTIAKATLGGAIFGVVGVALPLTMFSGGDQLSSILKGVSTLGLGLDVVILIAKMLTYAISQCSGFVGGPIFPSLFVGGTAGVVVHEAVPGVPLGLAFSCLLPAVLGSLAAAPFSMVVMAGFLTRSGPLQTAPVLITVVTAFLGVEGVKYLIRHDLPCGWQRQLLGTSRLTHAR